MTTLPTGRIVHFKLPGAGPVDQRGGAESVLWWVHGPASTLLPSLLVEST